MGHTGVTAVEKWSQDSEGLALELSAPGRHLPMQTQPVPLRCCEQSSELLETMVHFAQPICWHLHRPPWLCEVAHYMDRLCLCSFALGPALNPGLLDR